MNEKILPLYKNPPDFKIYLTLLVFILVLWRIIFKYFNLYRSIGSFSLFREIIDITKASTASIILIITFTYFFRQYEFSRVIFLYFWIISSFLLSVSRIICRKVISHHRMKKENRRHVLVVGAGELAKEVALRMNKHQDLGLDIVGFLNNGHKEYNGVLRSKIIGHYEQIREIIKSHNIELVIIALALDEHDEVRSVLKLVEKEMVDIKLVPDFFQFITLRGETEEFEGLTFVNVQSSPLYGWNVINKRIFDTTVAFTAIIFTLPLMFIVAILIKITSRGSIIYKQERVGLDGMAFNMYKFRSMKVNSENTTGAVWAIKNDPRKTWIGTIMRNTSIDEIPQLFNVIKGEMSLVGPRPERDVFIKQFKEKLPRYMLRHKVKAGMTGWAQVNGWRGDTSIEKRIEHDLYYIENWSMELDVKILFLTLLRGFINKNAY